MDVFDFVRLHLEWIAIEFDQISQHAGRDRGAFTEWSVNTTTDPWTWTEVTSGGNVAGYTTLSDRSMRWGTNDIGAADFRINDGVGDVRSFATMFDDSGQPDAEAQAVYGRCSDPGRWWLVPPMR